MLRKAVWPTLSWRDRVATTVWHRWVELGYIDDAILADHECGGQAYMRVLDTISRWLADAFLASYAPSLSPIQRNTRPAREQQASAVDMAAIERAVGRIDWLTFNLDALPGVGAVRLQRFRTIVRLAEMRTPPF